MRVENAAYPLLVLFVFALSTAAIAGEDQTYPKIVNGSDVAYNVFPFAAAIQFSDAESLENPNGQYCGGSLISKRAILTAAHCVSKREVDGSVTPEPPELFSVKVGMVSYDLGQGVSRGVKEIKIHPRYLRPQNPAFAYDLAILILDEPIINIAPVKLGTQKQDKGSFPATVLGWGAVKTPAVVMSNDLIAASVTIKNPVQCSRDIRKDTHGMVRFNPSIQLCSTSRAGPCKGDSGGPLLRFKSGQPIEIGLVSFGAECGNQASAVFTRISEKDISKFIRANQ